MKKLLAICSLLSIIIMTSACNDGSNAELQKRAAVDSANFTTVQWIDTALNFGSINMGEKALVKFRCKNIGTKPLIITSAKPSCGCTVADYSKEPIVPNAEGWVTGSFDSNKNHNQGGDIHKTIIVSTNTFNGTDKFLVFTGTIRNAPNDKVLLPKEKK